MAVEDDGNTVTFATKGQIVIPRRLRRGRGLLKQGGGPLSQEWQEHKQAERALDEK